MLSFEIIFSAENLLKPQYKVRVKINDSNIEQSNIFDEIALTKKEATKKYYISFANSMLHSRKYFLEQKRRLQGELDITDEILSSYIKEIMRCLKHLRKSNIEIKKIMAVGALE